MKMSSQVPVLVGSAAGMGIATASALGYKKATGKCLGAKGSYAHIMSNDKLSGKDKLCVMGDQIKESAKDCLKLGGIALGTGAAASLAVGNSNKAAGVFNNIKSSIADVVGCVSISGKNLKDAIKETKVFQKINSLPTPAKAGILAATAALAIVAPIIQVTNASKMGYIEGSHETH